MSRYADAIMDMLEWIKDLHGPAARSAVGQPWLVPETERGELVWTRAQFEPDNEIEISGILEGLVVDPAELREFIRQARTFSDD